MRAMVLKRQKGPLVLEEIAKPRIDADELLIKVNTCGVCRTDLHIKDGELTSPKLPLVLGHQIVGHVVEVGNSVKNFQKNDLVGVPWLGETCGTCQYCSAGKENLCENAKFTGYTLDGGFAEYAKCKADFAIHLPKGMTNLQMAPLLCAGLIGYRAYRLAAPEKRLGIYGFGSAAHILTQIAVHEKKEVYAFTRVGDKKTQDFAKSLGAIWAGDSNSTSPELLDAAIIFAPAGELVPLSLKALKKGGRCICGGIHMSDIPSFPYDDLWGEKAIQSVANLTRDDEAAFFKLLENFTIKTEVRAYPLEQADQALEDLRHGKFQGSAVLIIHPQK